MNRRVPRSKVSQERWLVSYADFITLLFALFVVLYAFAKTDQPKQSQVSAAIDSAFRSLSIAPALVGNPVLYVTPSTFTMTRLRRCPSNSA
jgi:chemotaxis protein MotB